jgi:hypothetical protein
MKLNEQGMSMQSIHGARDLWTMRLLVLRPRRSGALPKNVSRCAKCHSDHEKANRFQNGVVCPQPLRSPGSRAETSIRSPPHFETALDIGTD